MLFFYVVGCLPLRFDVEGEVAYMNGDLGFRSPQIVTKLIDKNPNLKSIVMEYCPGSLDDYAALRASRLIRKAGLSTRVAADGEIASGAVDFFIAGVNRSVEAGSKVGVHSWSDGQVEGADLERAHAEHDLYKDYYSEMGIPIEFYWFTLQAASSDKIHWMSIGEMKEYKVLND
jgi:hypothetical protein